MRALIGYYLVLIPFEEGKSTVLTVQSIAMQIKVSMSLRILRSHMFLKHVGIYLFPMRPQNQNITKISAKIC